MLYIIYMHLSIILSNFYVILSTLALVPGRFLRIIVAPSAIFMIKIITIGLFLFFRLFVSPFSSIDTFDDDMPY